MASKNMDPEIAVLCKKLDSLVAEFPTASLLHKANAFGKELITFLEDNPEVISAYDGVMNLVESLAVHWIMVPNPRVIQYGLEALMLLADVLKGRFDSCAKFVAKQCLTRLGDTKELLREKARMYFIKTVVVGAVSPPFMIDTMIQQLAHKNIQVPIEAQKIIVASLEHAKEIIALKANPKEYRPPLLESELVKKLLFAEIHALGQGKDVREFAETIILDLARGDKMTTFVMTELEKARKTVAANIAKRVDRLIEEVKNIRKELQAQQLLNSPRKSPPPPTEEDEPDLSAERSKRNAATSSHLAKRTIVTSATVHAPPTSMVVSAQVHTLPPSPKPSPRGAGVQLSSNTLGVVTHKTATLMKRGAVKRDRLVDSVTYALHSGPAGEADEAWFQSAFEDVQPVVCLNRREYTTLTNKIVEDLKSAPEFWERKVDALKKLRSMVMHLPGYEDDVVAFIKASYLLLVAGLKDLRSQVVRETCLSFAFFCKELKNKVDANSCEIILIQLMFNVMSSAKVIASASNIALKFMFTHVTHGRLLVTLQREMNNSKSTELRRAGCELLELLLSKWPVSRLEHHIPILQDLIKKGVAESSTEGRLAARMAFLQFASYFPELGRELLQSMDHATRKRIQGMLRAGEEQPEMFSKPRPKQTSARHGHSPSTDSAHRRGAAIASTSKRSNSAIDLHAVQRAKARQQYAALSRQKAGCIASLPRSKKVDLSPVTSSTDVERLSRDRIRGSGMTQSTPGSRSGSPSSSRSSGCGYSITDSSLIFQPRKLAARSRNSSRETSPIRFGRRIAGDRPPIQPSNRPVMAQKMLAQSLEAEQNEGLSLYDADTDSIGHKVSPRKASYRPFEDHSDDSDASSLCSERSFDSYRRTSDSYSWSGSQQRLYRDVWESGTKDINEIIMHCESTAWSDRKEGLVGLQTWLQAGNTLDPTQLKLITECFTKMFMDSHTKIFSLFLDTLNELLVVHRADLNSWLYILLTRLLNKLGGDLLGSIQNKIQKSLNTVRESFPPELQMLSLLRFLTDHTQTPNLRVKTAALNYITKLAAITDPSQAFPQMAPGTSRDPVQAALHKMIGWTMGDGIKQGNELRRAAQEAILALFNLNTPQVTKRLANLPQEYQEAAATLLRCRVRRGSSSSSIYAVTSSPPSPSSHHRPSHHRASDTESDLDPEDVFKSLRKTTAEIQNYTFKAGTDKPPDKDNTTSKDSGISQLSGTEALEEALEELSIQSSSSSNATTTTLMNRVLTVRDCNGIDSTDNNQPEDSPVDEQDAMRKIVEALRSPPDSDNGENISIISESEKRASLSHLTRLIRESSITTLQDNFKSLLRILLGNLSTDTANRDVQTRMLVLTALTELIKKRAMTESLNHYVELLILKVLNSYKDTSKEVVRTAEICANTIAITLAPSMVIRVLAPLIQTGEYPLNLAAVKMLTRLVETCGRDPVYEFLPDLMPGLIQAYDNQESSVRKSAVFCMVSLHAAIGEEDLKPHLTALNGSKLKLLHLYIRRAQQGSSAPTSPRNHPPPAPSS